MRRFESIVMSETEPVPDGTLWLKKKKNSINNEGPNSKKPFGFDIWWFGPVGWQPLLDLDTNEYLDPDTRYEYVNHTLTGGVGTVPVLTEQTKFPEIGQVRIDTTYSVYDGSRALAANTNIVNETGLKKHVDDLQSQINALKARVATLESEVASLTTQVSNNSSKITSNINAINSLGRRVSFLETA